MSVLKVRELTKVFSLADGTTKYAVDRVSFSVEEGEFLGVVGRSGCGKSTLLRLIAGLETKDGGSICIDGVELGPDRESRKAARQKMAMIFQQPQSAFDPRRTLGWSICEPLMVRGVKRTEAETRAKELLSEVGLSGEILCRYPREVSGGQCQRAAIVRALLVKPRLLLADEVTSALDVVTQKEIVALLARLCKEEKIACLFITHDLPLLDKTADRVLVMQDGQKREEGQLKELLAGSHSAALQELLEAQLL